MARFRRRSRAERLRDRGDVRRLARRLDAHEWLVARDGSRTDLAVGERLEAVVALGEIATEEAEAAIAGALGDRDVRVRRAAVEALGPSPGVPALKLLARAAAGWDDPALADLREAAVALLVEVGDELAAVEFAHVLVDDPERSALDTAEEEALRRLFDADRGSLAAVLAEELASRLGAGDDAAHRAWQTLVAMGDVAVGPLIAALDDAPRQPAAAAALGALRDGRAVDPLAGVLANAPAPARAAAARALGEIRDPRAVPALVQATADADAHVRDAAMDGLDRMRGVVLAMLGAAARPEADDAPPAPAPGNAAAGPALRPPRGVERSLVQRLLDR
jgi:HEAT repeat protein